jgi:ribonuclease P/MRP protein subunit RPP1
MLQSSIFYDLCVTDAALEPQTQRERISVAMSYGYDAVAFAHQASARLGAGDKCSLRLLSREELVSATKGLPGYASTADTVGLPSHGNPYRTMQLTRLSFPVDDTNMAQESISNTAVMRSYDLVAAQPQNERAFVFACTVMDVDLISLDLSRRLPFRFRAEVVQAAVKRGIHFEVLYSSLLRDPASRRQMISNVQALARETRGRAIVLSSSARTVFDLRGTYDVANMGCFLGLNEQQARAAVTNNPAAVVQHAKRRKLFKGMLLLRPLEDERDTELLLSKGTGDQKAGN